MPVTGGSYTTGFTTTATGLLTTQLITFNAHIIAALGASTTGGTKLASAAASAPTSWTGTLPGFAVTDWRLVTDGASIVLALPWGSTSTSTPDYFTSPDGVTWTPVAYSSTLLLSVVDSLLGICWSPVRQAFYAVVARSGGLAQVYTSTNGTGWTAVSMVTTSVGTIDNIVDLAAIGPNLVATQTDSGGTGSRLLWSQDGGATWFNAPASFATSASTSSTGYIFPRVIQGDNSLMAVNNLVGRFSDTFGRLPAVHL